MVKTIRKKPVDQKLAAPRDPWRWLAPLLIAAAVWIVYANSLKGVFLLDDHRTIVKNENIRTLWPPWDILSTRRPITELTLAINYALNDTNERGYHLFNITVHMLAALTLYGLVRRTLLTDRLREGFAASATPLALAGALIWAVHPLNTQAVTYIIQRAESLASLFYLLTLYALVRMAGSSKPLWPAMIAVASCFLGIGSKPIAVTAPVAALLYDRIFLADSWRHLLQRRGLVHLGLFASWTVLLLTGEARNVLFPTPGVRGHVGFALHDISATQYAVTQVGVIAHYLKLSVWPITLCFDYAWPTADSLFADWPSLLIVVGALILSLILLAFRPALGFLGLAFFVVLSPTSSFIPIKDVVFEHRMYLPLAALITLLVLGAFALFRTLSHRNVSSHTRRRTAAAGLTALAVLLLGVRTIDRNRDYHSQIVMFSDVIRQQPQNARAWNRLGAAYADIGKMDEAVHAASESVKHNPEEPRSHSNLCAWLYQLQRDTQALPHCRKAVELDPEFWQAHFNLGLALFRSGALAEGVATFRESARLKPDNLQVQLTLGQALERAGRMNEARSAYEVALKLDPKNQQARQALSNLKGN